MNSNAHLATSRIGSFSPFTIDRSVVTTLGRVAKSTVWLLVLGVGYALAARLSQQELFLRSRLGLFWAPNALVLSALLLTPRRWWIAVFAVCASAHLLAMDAANPGWRMTWQIAANGVFDVATAEVLRRFLGLPLRFANRRVAFVYTALVFAMPLLIASTAPAFPLSLMRVETLFSPAVAFLRVVLANVSPLLLVTPAILLCARLDAEWMTTLTPRRAAEGAIILASVVIVSIVAFDAKAELARFPWLLVLTFPPLVWAAIRLGPTGASVSLLCIGALSLAGAVRRQGPFVASPNGDAVLSLQVYWILIALPILWLAATMRERQQVESALRQGIDEAHATRIAMVREISGPLDHELRQPLTAILANAQSAGLVLSREPTDLPLVRGILHDIEQENGHAVSIISRLQLSLTQEERQREAPSMEMIASPPDSSGTEAEDISRGGQTVDSPARLSETRPLIAILDDEKRVGTLARLCRAHGLEAREFTSERDLFAALARERPDCLVLDAEMSSLGGLEMHRWLRDHDIDLPTILITGRRSHATRVQAFVGGVNANLTKPIDGDTLITAIRRMLRESTR